MKTVVCKQNKGEIHNENKKIKIFMSGNNFSYVKWYIWKFKFNSIICG